MAEIVESPNPAGQAQDTSKTTQGSPSQSESVFDSATLRITEPGMKRLFLTFSVLLSFLLGFPLLWKSVEIYRSSLPFHAMDALSNDSVSNPLTFPCHFQALFINSNHDSSIKNAHDLALSILSQVTKLTPHPNFTLSVTVDGVSGDCSQYTTVGGTPAYRCGGITAVDFNSEDDDSVDEGLQSVLGGHGGVYTVVVINGGGRDDQGVRAMVGKYRHGWIVGVGKFRSDAVVERVAEMFVKVFLNGGREEGVIPGEFMPVGADGRIVLSFNLLNADPRDWIYDW